MRLRTMSLGCVFCWGCLAVPASAQDTVEGRLLTILRDRGAISEAEYSELRDLEAKMRQDDDLSLQIESRIETLEKSGLEGIRSGHKSGKGFWFETADSRFRLEIQARIQVRFTYDGIDENDTPSEDDEPEFDTRRAHLVFQGHAFEPYIKYRFHFDVAGDEADTTITGATFSSRNRLVEMKDGYVEFAKWEAFKIRAGSFKVPYSRQQIASSGALQFVDRSITDPIFAPARSYGVMLHGLLGGETNDLFEYDVGLFNGEGENVLNDDKGLMYAGRLQFNPFGAVGYTESDTHHSEDLRFTLAVNAWFHQDDNHQSQDDDWSIGTDAAVFYEGFFATGELHYRENGRETGPDVQILGWTAQVGYFIIPHELEIAVRAANIDWKNNGNGDSARREYLVALGYFWYDHRMVLQADFGRVEDHEGEDRDNIDEWRFRIQFQVIL